MPSLLRFRLLGLALSFLVVTPLLAQQSVELNFLGRYETGIFADGAAEIVAHEPRSQRLFVVNGADGSIDVLDASDPSNPTLAFSIDLSPYGKLANSVAVSNGVIAAAVENEDKQANGRVVFFDTDGNYLNDVEAGALPDMLTFTPNGRVLLVANEGEPDDDYLVDPEGTVTMIKMRRPVHRISDRDVTHIDFNTFNSATLDPSIRIFGPGATVAQDLEPEHIAVTANSRKAFVVMQENNALAKIDIKSGTVESLTGLGFKDYSAPGNAFDASNRDDAINIANWPVFGMYQPDAIASYRVRGRDYVISANEGDARDYDGYSEEERMDDLDLDPTVFPDAATLQLDENLGRLKTTTVNGDVDGDGDYDELYSYGARSFSIWGSDGSLVYDSGDILEQITASAYPDDFNSDDEENGSFDDRSDDKGPEPEGVVVGKAFNKYFAFVGLERMGGIVVFDVTDPYAPEFVQYINTRDYSGDPESGTAGDMSPEGLLFVDAKDSPTRNPLLVVSYEVSGTTAIFELSKSGVAASESIAAKAGVVELAGSSSGSFALQQNYPNPFSHATSIGYNLPTPADASLIIFDTMGRQVRTLATGPADEGAYVVDWDGTDDSGSRVASGLYFYRLIADGLVQVRSLSYVR